MTGIAITFSDECQLDLGRSVSGAQASAQNAAVNFITERSSKDIFSDRGTTLFSASVSGAIVDANSASHACNFAAADTLAFVQQFDVDGDLDALGQVTAIPTGVANMRLKIDLSFEALDGSAINLSL